jgi:hypothetical protein
MENVIKMELSEHLYLLFPNNMKLQKESTLPLQHSIENKQILQSKHTVAKTFIRTPSGNFNLNV